MRRVLKILILSDVLLLSSFGLISPVMSIFIANNLLLGSISAAGTAASIFLFTRSLIQMPVSNIADKYGKKNAIVGGTLLINMVIFGYSVMQNVYQLYILQFIYGVGAAFAYPAWLALFSTNLDKGHESHDYGVYGTTVGIATAITAFVGARIAEMIGFRQLFFGAFVISIFGLIILIIGLENDGTIRYFYPKKRARKSSKK